MKLSRSCGSVLSAVLAVSMMGLATVGCAADDDGDEAVGADEAELRAFRPSELAGTLASGQTVTIDHDGSPTYRVLSFDVEAGDTVALRVQAFGRDAVLWLLDDKNATLQRVDKTRDGEDEEIAYVAPKTARLQLAIREAKYRPAPFIVRLDVTPAIAPGVPACTGAPRFPATGSTATGEVVRIELRAACPGCGFVEVGRKTFPWSPIRIEASRRVTVDATLRTEAIPESGVTYDCTSTDTGAATLDATGHGPSSVRESRRCTVRGGSGGPSEDQGFRAGQATLGAACLSIVDNAETRRFVYVAKVK